MEYQYPERPLGYGFGPNLTKASPTRVLDEDDERHFCPFLEMYLMELMDYSYKVVLGHLQGTRESKLREQDDRDNGYGETVSSFEYSYSRPRPQLAKPKFS